MADTKPIDLLPTDGPWDERVVTVVGATGSLGGRIVEALLARGVRVRAMVRATSNRSRLEALGVSDFVIADLTNAGTLRRALSQQPRATAVIASAAGFSAHSAQTAGNDPHADIEGYRNLADAALHARIPRFVLISILGCDRAPSVPHFRQKLDAERHLAKIGQPYIALRAGAFLDRARDTIPQSLEKGLFPDILPGVPMALVYSRDLARYAVQAALDLPAAEINRSIDIGSSMPATGELLADAFSKVLGRPIRAKPVIPGALAPFLPVLGFFIPRLRDQLAVMRWLRKGGYVSSQAEMDEQKRLFGDLPSVEQIVSRYSHDVLSAQRVG